MAVSHPPLPEGTDSIITDSGVDVEADGGFGEGGFTAGRAAPGDATADLPGQSDGTRLGAAAAKVGEATAGLRAQAADKALGFAAQGKDRAVGLLDNVTRLVDEAAGQIDEKAGEQYGAYVRQASQTVSGFADSLRGKEVDELIDDARELVRKSPAIAIGAAAAIGFVVARLLKVSLAEATAAGASDTATPPPAPPSAARKTPSTATTVPADAGY